VFGLKICKQKKFIYLKTFITNNWNNFPFHQTPTKEISISFSGGASEASVFFTGCRKAQNKKKEIKILEIKFNNTTRCSACIFMYCTVSPVVPPPLVIVMVTVTV